MAVKYYMQFLLHEPETGHHHYSGVVEMEHAIQYPYAVDEVEELLAHSFEVDADDVRVIDWSMVH